MSADGDRFAHEETAGDRWTGALIEHRRLDGHERVDALVGRAVARVRAEAAPDPAPAPIPLAGRARRLGWRAPVAAAASVALVAGAAFLATPRPASAGDLLRAAQAAEAAPGDRRYRLELEFPPRPGSVEAPASSGTLDVRDDLHVRLELRLPDGRTMVRATDGTQSWSLTPEGDVVRVPGDAPWPRFVETPDGELLSDRLDAILGDVGAFYAIVRCDEGGDMRLCATRVDPSFRGPERIELTLDPSNKRVRRAELSFGRRGREGGHDGPPPHGAPDRAPRGDARPHGDERPHGGPPPRRPEPTRIVIERAEVPGGAFADGWFAPPSPPVADAPAPGTGHRRPPPRP
jgi:hypothetical protein